ncbi:MAG: hypothetical protein PHW01_01065 [Patescibacteria group bacterium]|nr:hypothetical protein [Patescibacteria group bacterium]
MIVGIYSHYVEDALNPSSKTIHSDHSWEECKSYLIEQTVDKDSYEFNAFHAAPHATDMGKLWYSPDKGKLVLRYRVYLYSISTPYWRDRHDNNRIEVYSTPDVQKEKIAEFLDKESDYSSMAYREKYYKLEDGDIEKLKELKIYMVSTSDGQYVHEVNPDDLSRVRSGWVYERRPAIIFAQA